MEKQIVAIVLMLLSLGLFAQEESPREFEYQEGDTTFTMKQYTFCLYLSGPERSQTKEEAAKLQEQHLAHLGSLEEQGLLMAGPFGDDSEKRGVLLFDLATNAEAEELIKQDPMVIEERLIYECHPLWLAKGTTLR